MELKNFIIFNCYGVKNYYPSSKLKKKKKDILEANSAFVFKQRST